MFDGEPKSVLVVGGADSLTYSNLGYKIDKFDIVVRINCALTKGYEMDVGSKFDIWCTCDNIFPKGARPWDFGFGHYFKYMKEQYSKEEITKELSKVKELWYATWDRSAINRTYGKRDLLMDYGLQSKLSRYQNSKSSGDCTREVGSKQTTGFAAIWLMNKLFDKIYITGFSYAPSEVEGYEPHYYTEPDMVNEKIDYKYYLDTASSIHKWERERNYIRDQIKLDTIVELSHIVKIEKGEPTYTMLNDKCRECKKDINVFDWEDDICHECAIK